MKDWAFNADELRFVPFEAYKFWHPPELTGWANALAKETYEPEVVQCLRSVLRSGMVFFDVGAHIGSYALLAASRVKRVFAFEPAPRNRQVLLQNIRRNGLGNVIVIAAPVFSEQSSGVLDSKHRFRPGNGGVWAVTLDRFGAVPDVIKVDVEGAEADVFLGGVKMLIEHKPLLVLELHPRLLTRFHRSPKDLEEILRRCGYGTWTCLGKKKHNDVSWWRIEGKGYK